MSPLSSPQRGGRRAEGGFCLSPDTWIRLQYNDAQLLGTDGHAKEIEHYRHRGSKLHTQAVGLWEEGNDGMETDCQHLLERHRSQRKIPDSGAKQDEKKVAESVSPLFVVDKKANIQAFDQKGIQRNKEVKSVLNELKHSVFKAQDFSRPKLCFNATLKLVL